MAYVAIVTAALFFATLLSILLWDIRALLREQLTAQKEIARQLFGLKLEAQEIKENME